MSKYRLNIKKFMLPATSMTANLPDRAIVFTLKSFSEEQENHRTSKARFQSRTSVSSCSLHGGYQTGNRRHDIKIPLVIEVF